MHKIPLLILFLSLVTIVSSEPVITCSKSLTSGDYVKALLTCEKELELLTNKDSIQQVEIFLVLVDIHHALGNAEQENYYLAKIKSNSNFLQDIKIQYNWNRKIGQKHYLSAQYELSKSYLDQGLIIAITEDNKDWMSKSYNDMGLVENKLENYQSAMSFYQKSLQLKRQIGDLYKIGTTLNNLGLVHKQLEEFDKSTEYYEQALDTFLEYTQLEEFDKRVSHNISHLYEDLSAIYIQSNNIEKASKYADKILSTFELKFSPHDQARALINLAKLQIVKGDYDQAKQSLEKAQQQKDFSIEIYFELAKINYSLDNSAKAIFYAQLGLDSALLKQHVLSMDFYKILSELYKDINPGKAFSNLEQYH